jgi:hypothetical protein
MVLEHDSLTSVSSPVSYGEHRNFHKKISTCGQNYGEYYNTKTGESKVLRLFCDNRSCLNPDCQNHRLYKYMVKHRHQINKINQNIRKPKSWIFTTIRKPYPIDKKFINDRTTLLRDLLNIKKHNKYGSTSDYTHHLEIKISPDSWYLHYHVVSGGMTDLRLIRQLWGYQIKYESAINPENLAYYISKYASKVPRFDSLDHYYQYANLVYKLKMHEFSVRGLKLTTDWVLVRTTQRSSSDMSFFELENWFIKYFDDFGYGG